ncbi:MAG: Bax inhibitor-1/YccA family membrane protein [Acidimicrobiales bacterium]
MASVRTRQPSGHMRTGTSRLLAAYPTGADTLAGTGRVFSMSGTLNKTAILTILALATAIYASLTVTSIGAGFVLALVAAIVVSLVGMYRPRTAVVMAPVYALLEGYVLGVVSASYARVDGAVVPLAVVGTATVFAATMVACRTGLIRPGRRFVQVTMVATFGLLAVLIVSLFVLPGLVGPFGVVIAAFALVIGAANLIVDFGYIGNLERTGLPANAEWHAALMLMVSLVLVFLSLLRLIGGAGGR